MIRFAVSAAALLLTVACSDTSPVGSTGSNDAPAPGSRTTDILEGDEADPGAVGAEPTQASITVPARFRGLYAADRRACENDYNYAPAFQNVTVKARDVSFFETGGPVTDVNVQGNNIAITLRETVGDGRFTRAIYLALNDDGTVRYRQAGTGPVKTYVRCAGE